MGRGQNERRALSPHRAAPCAIIGAMASRAEIGSLATTLAELTRRVSLRAEGANADDEETATELFGVERSLSGALRRLRKLAEPRRD